MDSLTPKEINRKVAEELGYTVEETHTSPRTDGSTLSYRLLRNGKHAWWHTGVDGWGRHRTREEAWAEIPNFSTDPAAADLVIKYAQDEGIFLEIFGPFPVGPQFKARASHTLPGKRGYGDGEGDLWTHALCVAVLVALAKARGEAGK